MDLARLLMLHSSWNAKENPGDSTTFQLLIFVEPKRDVSSVNCAEESVFLLPSAHE